MNLNNTLVLVTGGTRGIGFELVKQLMRRGARVISTGQTHDSVTKAQQAIPSVLWFVLDLSDESHLKRFVGEIEHLNINLLINNAGVQQLRDFTESDESLAFSTALETSINFVGPIELTARMLPILKKQKEAKVVFVTSGLALAPKRSSPVYCATKAALRSFAKSLRAQMNHSGWGISVSEALPPLVDTDMTKGRGSRKITADLAALQILNGIEADKDEIYIGASSLLRVIMRVSPKLGELIMVNR